MTRRVTPRSYCTWPAGGCARGFPPRGRLRGTGDMAVAPVRRWAGPRPPSVRDAVKRGSRTASGWLGEDADPTGPHQQPDDDEHDAPEELAADDRDDAGDHE